MFMQLTKFLCNNIFIEIIKKMGLLHRIQQPHEFYYKYITHFFKFIFQFYKKTIDTKQ